MYKWRQRSRRQLLHISHTITQPVIQAMDLVAVPITHPVLQAMQWVTVPVTQPVLQAMDLLTVPVTHAVTQITEALDIWSKGAWTCDQHCSHR